MAYRSSASLAGSSSATAAVPVPTGAAIGDIAVVGVYKESTAAITPPAGFTQKANLTTSATARGSLTVFWKRLTAADAGTYSFTWTGAAWRAGVAGLWSGRIATGDPFDGTVGTAESVAAVSTLNVSTSPAAANGDAVGLWTDFNSGNSWTPAASYTERVDLAEITLDSRDAVASGSTGNVSPTANTSDFLKAFLGVLAVASSGFTGTAAPIEAADNSSASGQLGYSGTSARTEAADTSSAAGTVVNPVTGTSAVTQANQTSSASGQLGYSGTSARTQAANTSAASGQLGYSGTSARTQANQTSTASGSFTAGGSFSGTASPIEAADTSSATGQLGYSGTSARTQANQTSSATGAVVNPVTGTASPIQANQVSTATGKLGYTGTAARFQANQTASATGAVVSSITGSAAASQANQTASIAGYFAALVSFGTSGGGGGTAPSSHPNQGLVPFSTPAVGTAPSASGGSTGIPTSTGA